MEFEQSKQRSKRGFANAELHDDEMNGRKQNMMSIHEKHVDLQMHTVCSTIDGLMEVRELFIAASVEQWPAVVITDLFPKAHAAVILDIVMKIIQLKNHNFKNNPLNKNTVY